MHYIIDQVVKKNLCCGCGICAGVVEKCDLSMKFNQNGEYEPEVMKCNDCGLCLSVCPFYDKGNDEKTLSLPLGDYIECFVGYSMVGDERARGSSGGLVTRVSKALLENKMVDGVIAVGQSNKKDTYFEPTIARTVREIDSCARTKYYPVEFSDVLRQIKSENGRYAVIGLPCVISGLRLVQQRYPELGRKIKYLFGLVCGHNKNKNYTSFLLELEGVKEKDIATVFFRSKENTKRAINYGFKGILKDGKEAKQLNFQDSLVKDVWCKRYFSLGACFHCRDLFAEQADISFMDAWLNPYMADPRGTSIIVIRNHKLKNLIEKEKNKGNLRVERIDKKDVIKSQKGALDFKKDNISKKKTFLFNKWLSNKFYSGSGYTRMIGVNLLRIYILLSEKLKKIKRILLK